MHRKITKFSFLLELCGVFIPVIVAIPTAALGVARCWSAVKRFSQRGSVEPRCRLCEFGHCAGRALAFIPACAGAAFRRHPGDAGLADLAAETRLSAKPGDVTATTGAPADANGLN